MQTWEYARIYVSMGEVAATHNVEQSCLKKDIDETLALMGQKGWELVTSVSTPNRATYILFLKRATAP